MVDMIIMMVMVIILMKFMTKLPKNILIVWLLSKYWLILGICTWWEEGQNFRARASPPWFRQCPKVNILFFGRSSLINIHMDDTNLQNFNGWLTSWSPGTACHLMSVTIDDFSTYFFVPLLILGIWCLFEGAKAKAKIMMMMMVMNGDDDHLSL